MKMLIGIVLRVMPCLPRRGKSDQIIGTAVALSFAQHVYRVINNVLATAVGMHLVRAKPKCKMGGYDIRVKPEKPRYLNVGAGKWRHPLWHNLDHPFEGYEKSQGSLDIAHDLMSDKPFEIADNSVKAVFTSHTIEHLNDQYVLRMFKNIYRCLEPGGYFRITCPDAALAYRFYSLGDKSFWEPHDKDYTLEQLFLSVFSASYSNIMDADEKYRISDEEVKRVFTEMPMEQAFDHFTKDKPVSLISKHPQSHDTWFTEEKLMRMLAEAGFTNVWASKYGQSICQPMRDLGYFDTTRPDISLFVECQK